MNREPVSSSNLSSVGYDQSNQILEIEFHGGRVYQYFDVPSRVHQALMNASSHGKYFHRNIKDNYNYNQIR
ncbi:KTSC domain-containing protein [Haloferax volcanii]|uniref:KTSC domain-containing protein n=1 Tax=Haloferax volcanii TaxID=2246 RepID=UPI0038547601